MQTPPRKPTLLRVLVAGLVVIRIFSKETFPVTCRQPLSSSSANFKLSRSSMSPSKVKTFFVTTNTKAVQVKSCKKVLEEFVFKFTRFQTYLTWNLKPRKTTMINSLDNLPDLAKQFRNMFFFIMKTLNHFWQFVSTFGWNSPRKLWNDGRSSKILKPDKTTRWWRNYPHFLLVLA